MSSAGMDGVELAPTAPVAPREARPIDVREDHQLAMAPQVVERRLGIWKCRPTRDRSLNGGVTDVEALLAGRSQRASPPSFGQFKLHRIADAVPSRNVHSVIYDALQLCIAL